MVQESKLCCSCADIEGHNYGVFHMTTFTPHIVVCKEYRDSITMLRDVKFVNSFRMGVNARVIRLRDRTCTHEVRRFAILSVVHPDLAHSPDSCCSLVLLVVSQNLLLFLVVVLPFHSPAVPSTDRQASLSCYSRSSLATRPRNAARSTTSVENVETRIL